MIATPALLLPDVGTDATQIVALLGICVGFLVFIEYASNYPSFMEFRHAPPFNRVRFLGLFLSVFLLTVMLRGLSEATAISEFLRAVSGVVAGIMDLPFTPVRNMVLAAPISATPEMKELVRTLASIASLTSILTLLAFVFLGRFFHWPSRYSTFNVWINLPTFDPTVGGDVVERLRRDGRLNIALGFLLPFLIPAVLKIGAGFFDPFSMDTPQQLIWTMAIWSYLPCALFMRGIAMGRIARLIEEKRRQRYAEFGEDGALA